MNVLVFGAQGSGKSTHAKYIAEKLGLPWVYTGNLFRELEKENSERGQKVKELLSKGLLIPDSLAISAFNEYLKKFDISKGVVLDGFPRNIDQAKSLAIKIDLLIYITLPERIAIERLIKRGRCDDTPGAIRTRLNLFKEKKASLISYFGEKRAKIVEVNNSPPVEVVQKEIDELLKQQRNKNNG
jgi:adenylate kinase